VGDLKNHIATNGVSTSGRMRKLGRGGLGTIFVAPFFINHWENPSGLHGLAERREGSEGLKREGGWGVRYRVSGGFSKTLGLGKYLSGEGGCVRGQRKENWKWDGATIGQR